MSDPRTILIEELLVASLATQPYHTLLLFCIVLVSRHGRLYHDRIIILPFQTFLYNLCNESCRLERDYASNVNPDSAACSLSDSGRLIIIPRLLLFSLISYLSLLLPVSLHRRASDRRSFHLNPRLNRLVTELSAFSHPPLRLPTLTSTTTTIKSIRSIILLY
jgi:hypothetical protein